MLAPSAASSLLHKATELLRAAHRTQVNGLPAVHGDARPDNIMVLMEDSRIAKLQLIDMDWAGPENDTQYPVLLNMRAILWPHGVCPGQPMKQVHDLELLSLQLSPTTLAGMADWKQMI